MPTTCSPHLSLCKPHAWDSPLQKLPRSHVSEGATKAGEVTDVAKPTQGDRTGQLEDLAQSLPSWEL